MQLLPDLFQITPDLYSIYFLLTDGKDFSALLKPAKDLIEEAILLYYPDLLFENEEVFKKLESASSHCYYLLSDSNEQVSRQAGILYGYCKALIAAYYCYQGQWKSAKKTIKESQSIAVKLVKKEKSGLHLCFQACIKAFSARILFTLAEYEQAQKMFASSIRLFKQAMKKGESPQWLIKKGLQRTSLQAGDICFNSKEYEQAFEYYDLSFSCADYDSSSMLYNQLHAEIEDENTRELFAQLLSEMTPRDLLPEAKEQEETEFDFKEMEEALLASRLQAMLIMEYPDYYDLLSFFSVLYFLLEYWYRKVPEEERMSNKDLILLCRLFSTYQNSQLFTRLFGEMWNTDEQEEQVQEEKRKNQEGSESKEEESEEEEEDEYDYEVPPVPEKFQKDLFNIPEAFEAFAKEIEEEKKIERPNAFQLTTDQRGQALDELYHYYEEKMFRSPSGVRFDESIEYQIYPIEAYLYLVSLINQSSRKGQDKADSYTFFDLCWSLMGGYYDNEEDYKLGYFFGKRIFDCMGKDDPLEWFFTYGNLLDFYTEFYNFCFGAGEDGEGYRYRWKVDQIKEELYKSGFYNQPDWMFR